MGDYWFTAGLLMAVFGPLSLLLPGWLLYRRDGHVRYRREGKGIATDPIPEVTAAYLVRSGFDVRPGGINVARTEIIKRAACAAPDANQTAACTILRPESLAA